MLGKNRPVAPRLFLLLVCSGAFAQTSYPLVGLKTPGGQARTHLTATAGSDEPGAWLSGVEILTAASLTVHEDDPFRYNGGTEFEGISGTWNSGQLIISRLPYAVYPNGTGGTTHITFVGTADYDDPEEPGDPFPIDPLTLFDIKYQNDWASSQSVPVAYRYRFSPFGGMLTDGSSYGESADVASMLDVGANATVVGNVIAAKGIFGAPVGLPTAGGVSSTFGLYSDNLHAYSGFYASSGAVFGFGRQAHSQDGSIWIETVGTCVTPTCLAAPAPLYQETKIYTDMLGTVFDNTLHGFNQGHIGNWFRFTTTVATSGSLESSSSLKAGSNSFINGRLAVGTGTVPTSGDQLQVTGDADVSGDVAAATFTGSGASLTGIPKLIFVSTADASVSNTGSETNLSFTGVGSKTLTAGTLTVGKTYRVTAYGTYANASGNSSDFALRMKLGSVNISQLTYTGMFDSLTFDFSFSGMFTCRSTGGSGSVAGGAEIVFLDGSTPSLPSADTSGGPVTVDTTASNEIHLSVDHSEVSVDTFATVYTFTVEALN